MGLKRISIISFILFCNVLLLTAQVDSKYLAGGVPLVDGKVQFNREVKVSSEVSKDKLYELVNNWMSEEFAPEEGSKQRILIADKAQSYIVAQGDEKLVFKSMALMVDQTVITYQLIARVETGSCNLEMRNIRYEYQDYKESMPAEEMITDKIALHKSGEKLNRHYDKFRTFTIDRVDELQAKLTAYLGNISLDNIKKEDTKKASILDVEKEPVKVVPSPSVPAQGVAISAAASEMVGYRSLNASGLSDAILKMFKDSRAVAVASADGESLALTATWSGLANFGGKQTAMVFANTDGHKLGKDATITISFLTEINADALDRLEGKSIKDRLPAEGLTAVETASGNTAFNEAWIVIECKMTMEQDSSESAVKENAQSKLWKDNKNPRLLMGEILNIWAR